MEDSLGTPIEPKQVEHIFLYEQFEEVCPFFISIGMTYEQFWYGDPTMTRHYLKAFKLKEERELKKARWARWEQGLYEYKVACSVAPIIRAFSKATKPLPYPEKPFGLEDEEYDEEKQKKKKELEIARTQIFFENWVRMTANRFKEKGEKNEQ